MDEIDCTRSSPPSGILASSCAKNEPYDTTEGQVAFFRALAARRYARKSQTDEQGEGREKSPTGHVTFSDNPIQPERDDTLDNGAISSVNETTDATTISPPADMPALDTLKILPELQRAEMEFSWELYLEEMNAYPVPRDAFQHVKLSLENGLEDGQFLEYVYPPEAGKKVFWYVELIHARGPEAFVRYFGLQDHPEEAFWLDLRTAEVYSFGCCDRKIYTCRPPKVVCKHRAYLGDLLEKSKKGLPSPTSEDLQARGVPLKDRFEIGLWMEVIDDEKPSSIWPAVVEKNVGGRLLLQFRKPRRRDSSGNFLESAGKEEEILRLWIFCTDLRLQVVGRGLKGDFTYAPPNGLSLTEESITETKQCIQDFISGKENGTEIAGVPDVFVPFTPTATPFAKSYHVEFLHPHNKHQIFPAVVSDVFSNGTMAVEILDFRPEGKKEKIVKICHSQSLEVLPAGWAKENAVRLRPPAGWNEEGSFTWDRVQKKYGLRLAPKSWFPQHSRKNLQNLVAKFSRGKKLEVCNPSQPDEICTATVVKDISPLLWIHIDSYGQSSNHYFTSTSMEIFAIGFCGSNNYSLKLPRLMTHGRRMAAIRSRSQSQNVSPSKSSKIQDVGESHMNHKAKEKSPEDTVTVYINPQCSCGPLLNSKKLINLPKRIGPGPVQLVLECVVTSLISCGLRQPKMLTMIGALGENPRSANWDRIKIKAKIGGRRQMAHIDVVKHASQVPDYLRNNVCILYEACPYLITTEPFVGKCPDRCEPPPKPDPKTGPFRRGPFRPGQKALKMEEAVPLNGESVAEEVQPVKEAKSAQVFEQAESEEETDPAGSQTGIDEEVETVTDSVAPSRAATPETESPLLQNGKSHGRSQDEVDDVAEPLRKKLRRKTVLAKSSSGREVSILEMPPSTPPTTEKPAHSSSSDSEEFEEPAGSKTVVAPKKTGSSDTENQPTNGRLVDDSEYLLHFFKHPASWTVEDVFRFLSRHLPSSRAPEVLKREGIDGDVLMMMCASDMKYLKLEDYDAVFIGNLIERVVFSLLLTKGQRIPLYSNWK